MLASCMEAVIVGGVFAALMLIAAISLFATSRRIFLFKRNNDLQKLQQAMTAYSVFWACWAVAGLLLVALTFWERTLFHWLENRL